MPIVIWRGTTNLVEQPNSPRWAFGERITKTRIFKGPHELCLESAPLRGAIEGGTGMHCLQSTVEKEKGGIGVLTVEYEGSFLGAPLPADEPKFDPLDPEVELHKHPFFAALTEEQRHAARILVENVGGTTTTEYTTAKGIVDQSALTTKYYKKLNKGFTHYTGAGGTFTLNRAYWSLPGTLTIGGFRETPPGGYLALIGDLDWLRLSDRVAWNGSHWTVESRWTGAPDLDDDIYP